MKKRTLCVLLAMLMAVSAVSCSNSEANKDTSESTPTSSGTTETEAETIDESTLTDREKRALVSDDLPASMDYGGDSFRVMVPTERLYEIVSEELTADNCNDAVYNRDLDIETRFNIKIEATEDSEPWSQLKTIATAGTNDYELVTIYDYLAYVPITSNSVLNWTEIPNVNLDKPWHNQLANENSTINDRLYAICSDLSITSMTYTHAFFFNVDMMENYGYKTTDLYDMVKEGKWTFDTFSTMVADMYEDKNGNGKKDTLDIYGFGYYIENAADVWLAAFDQPIIDTSDGNINLVFMCDKTVSILDKLSDFHTNNAGYIQYTGAAKDEETKFLNGNLVMAPLRFYAAFNSLREMDSTYSLLPYPKWDENQEDYYTNADDKFSVFCVPIPAYSNQEFVGMIYEALCAESYKNVYPEYYDVALKGKYSSDEDMAEIVDIIMSGRNFDFSFQFGETVFGRLPYLIRDMLLDGDTNLASKYKTKEKAITKLIDKQLYPAYFD